MCNEHGYHPKGMYKKKKRCPICIELECSKTALNVVNMLSKTIINIYLQYSNNVFNIQHSSNIQINIR